MKKLFTALIFTLATTVWAGDFEDGVAAYNKGDFTTAASLLQTVAEEGFSTAQVILALMYEKGKGVPQDSPEAVHWYKLAAAQGNAYAQLSLGHVYSNGKGILPDYAEAVRWYKLAAEQGNKSAQYNLEVMYYSSEEVLQDYLQAHMRINLIH